MNKFYVILTLAGAAGAIPADAAASTARGEARASIRSAQSALRSSPDTLAPDADQAYRANAGRSFHRTFNTLAAPQPTVAPCQGEACAGAVGFIENFE